LPPPPWFLALGATLLIAGAFLLVRILRERAGNDAEEVRGGPGKAGALALAVPWVAGVVWGLPILVETLRAAGLL
jgi:hypothetical protein